MIETSGAAGNNGTLRFSARIRATTATAVQTGVVNCSPSPRRDCASGTWLLPFPGPYLFEQTREVGQGESLCFTESLFCPDLTLPVDD